MFVHNTAIKKNASEILETNALSKPIALISDMLVPVVPIQPKIDIYKSKFDQGTGVTTILYVTPTNQDFYLTGMSMSVNTSGGAGNVSIEVKPKDTPLQLFQIDTAITEGGQAIHIPFPFRGLLLERGSNVTAFTLQASAAIQGYLGSDRS
jgi:hypothetical protein